MYKDRDIKGGSRIIVTDEGPTGEVNLILADETGVETWSTFTNSQVFTLALDLLSCVEHKR
jgi:hypothetical protein